jgi:methylglutaconyl-CoA hydratase
MSTPCVAIEHDGPVARVWLQRPEVRNAFDAATIAALTDAFATLAQDLSLRAIVLGSRGPSFCAGADLQWMREAADQDWDDNHRDAARLAHMLWTLASCPMPVLARVQGDCHGGGVGLVACCDIVVASQGVGFALSEARLGLIPATISPYVIQAIGERAARRYFLTAERFEAERAQDLGLVHEVCAPEALDDTVNALLHRILANGPMAVRACKQLVKEVAHLPLNRELRELTARRIADVRASDEGREGLRAFLARSQPAWQVGLGSE